MGSEYATPDTIEAKALGWLERIAPYRQHDLEPRPSKSALVVVDMQRFFLDPASPTFTSGGPAAIPGIARLIEAFRKAGRPVIYTKHVHHPDDLDSGIMKWWWKGKCVEGSPESEIDPSLAPLPREKVVLKHRYSAFFDTDLGTVLRCLAVEDLVLCGVMTNLCVESTARDAYFRDYRVFVPADGTGSIDENLHVASLMALAFGFACVTTCAAVASALEAPERNR